MTDHASGRGFSIGSVLSRGFSIYFSNLMSFLPLSLIAYIPIWAAILILGDTAAAGPEAISGGFGIMMLAGLVAGYWLQAALVYGTIATMRGNAPGMGETFTRSLAALGGVLILGIVMTIIIGLGTLLFIVPGIIISVMFFVAIPAAVVERGGVGASLTRSRELTAGHRWQLFALVLILVVVMIVIGLVVGIALGVGGMVAAGGGGGGAIWIQQLFNMVLGGIWATIIAVAYHDLRIAREGGDTEQIARSFD
ncbi:MAG: hypothetical protein O2825_14630 [Proteobacteria bacterium]|nr:hypothetical protein [Pseudomonadota bacterium]MDA1072612.1 hypothetical protein [Pseudomonadota bacterium]